MFSESKDHRLVDVSETTRRVLSKIWVITGITLKTLGRFPIFEDIRHQLVRFPMNVNCPFFISHRWEDRATPDPRNEQYAALHLTIRDDGFYWYDYSCVPQQLCNAEDERYMQYLLGHLNELAYASKMIILRRSNDDYFQRGWCFHEWFTVQYTGLFGRSFLYLQPNNVAELAIDETVTTKQYVDRIMCGEYQLLNELAFTKDTDRRVVRAMTESVIRRCQMKICSTCVEILAGTVEDAQSHFPTGLSLTADDIHRIFPRLVRFIKVWTEVLQPIERVSGRVALFFHSDRWESFMNLTHPQISAHLIGIMYATRLRVVERDPVSRELRAVYEYCQLRFPQSRHTVVAFLCLLLIGYEI